MAAALLRIDSVQAFDIVARNATAGRLGYDELCALITSPTGEATSKVADFDPAWLLTAGRIIALRRGGPDPAGGLALFDLVRAAHGLDSFDRASLALYAQLLVVLDRDRLPGLLARITLPAGYRWSVEVDAVNPFTGAGGSLDPWLDKFNTIFAADGLEPVSLGEPAATAFDRLAAEPSEHIGDDHLVTVVMSSYRPTESVVTAVKSILHQSWRNLELLIVDDASPPEYQSVLRDVADLDDRIRVLTAPVNGGTYLARNLALEQARGEFVTFQDSDDWTHPRRIERQVAALLADKRLLATRSPAVRAFPDLTFTYIGYPPDRINASSLLFRRGPVMNLIGYFDAVRKSADVEYTERLQAAAPGSLLDLTGSAPLAITQLRPDSLSRSDAIPGWLRWSRVAYRDAFRARHAHVGGGAAQLHYDGDPGARALPLPEPSWAVNPGFADPNPHYDVVVVNDWRRSRGAQLGTIDDIRDMLDNDLRVAVAHSETLDPLSPKGKRESLSTPIQELINGKTVDLVHVTQPVHAELVLVSNPATLQFLPDVSPALKPERVAVLVDSDETADVLYHVADCADNAERLFARRPVWVPRDEPARAALAPRLPEAEISGFTLGRTFDPARLAVPVRRLRLGRPVIGRHVPDSADRWPAAAAELLRVYPDDDGVDVRIAGGHATPLEVLGRGDLPPNWVSYDDGQVDTRTFLAQLDFFVYFPGTGARTVPGSAALEAMASGCVVVLPAHFEPAYGSGAVYCEPGEVREVITALYTSPGDYAAQLERGYATAHQHGTRGNGVGPMLRQHLIGG